MKQHYLSVFNLQESLLNTNKNIFPRTLSETSMCALEFVWVRTGTAGLFCMSHGILEHTEPDALCEGLRATIMQQDLISCSSDPSFLPRLFVLFLFVPQPVFFVKRSLSYHTHTHTPQYPLCENHGLMRPVQIKSSMPDQTKLPNRWNLHPAPTHGAAM